MIIYTLHVIHAIISPYGELLKAYDHEYYYRSANAAASARNDNKPGLITKLYRNGDIDTILDAYITAATYSNDKKAA